MRLYYIGHIGGKVRYLTHGIVYESRAGVAVPIRLVGRAGVEGELQSRTTTLDRRYLIVLYVDVPKKWLVRRGPRVWVCLRDVPAKNVKGELFVEA